MCSTSLQDVISLHNEAEGNNLSCDKLAGAPSITAGLRGLAMGGNSGSWLRTGRSSGYGGRAFVRVARLVHGVVDVSEAHPQGAGAIRVLPARLPPQRSRRHVHEVLHVHVEVALLVTVSAVHALRDLRGSLATSR